MWVVVGRWGALIRRLEANVHRCFLARDNQGAADGRQHHRTDQPRLQLPSDPLSGPANLEHQIRDPGNMPEHALRAQFPAPCRVYLLGDHLKTGHLWSLQNRPLWMA